MDRLSKVSAAYGFEVTPQVLMEAGLSPFDARVQQTLYVADSASSSVRAIQLQQATVQTLVGHGRKPGTTMFVIDFEGPAVKEPRELPVAEVNSSAGAINNLVIQRNPEISGLRVSFELTTGGTEVIELRLALRVNDQLLSESWLYRWTRS